MIDRVPRASKTIARIALAALLLPAAVLISSCRPSTPSPAPTADQSVVETRVAATLTALASTTTPTAVPSPTDTSPPPLATATHTETLLPPTPTWTEVPLPTATPTRTTTPPPVITDWRGEYYANRDLVGDPALVRNDVAVHFDWGEGSPAAGLPADSFSARWTRALDFEGVMYRFSVFVDDAVRLWVDGELIINEWHDSASHTVTVLYPMVRGTHTIKLEYYEHGGRAHVQLWWEKAESYPDWKGEYWSNRDLSGSPAIVRNDQSVDFDWGSGAPRAGLPADNFSARWTRSAYFDGQAYRFHALVDDGVRLWLDNVLVIDAWYDHEVHELRADYALVRGTHSLRVEYYERAGGARVRVWWEKVASPSYPDWRGEYWPNRTFGGSPELVRNDKTIDFDWGSGPAAYGLPKDDFSVRWSRAQGFETGIYRFHARTDDGMRFYIDGERVLDEWHDGLSEDLHTADLALAGIHDLVVEYYEHTGLAQVRFWWTLVQAGPPRD
ncbi:MAG: hypothetical protein AMJ93_10445 [Anaerolineae bacterium SM23_84]|nr:MAG: hypothetical protein AMJ93_10445 [Anaerolineae bacterium SM23_84]